MEEDIKMLEWSQQQMRLGNLPNYNQKVYKAIENLINRNKEIERKLKIKTGDVGYLINKINKHFIDDVTLQQDYIPKSKVKEKIEEDAFEVHTREYGNIEVIAVDSIQKLLESGD